MLLTAHRALGYLTPAMTGIKLACLSDSILSSLLGFVLCSWMLDI